MLWRWPALLTSGASLGDDEFFALLDRIAARLARARHPLTAPQLRLPAARSGDYGRPAMRCSTLVLLSALLACRSHPSPSGAAPDAGAAPFEGEIDLSVGPFSCRTQLKGNKSHVAFMRADGRMVGELFVDGDAGEAYTPLGGRKYAEVPLSLAASPSKLVAKKTGAKDSVLGHECEELVVIDGMQRREICLATDLPPLLVNVAPSANGGGYEPSFGRGFPLRIKVIDPTNRPAVMVATRIERKPIADSEVEIHADWPKVLVGADAGAPAP